ncbi:uncharacterized protein KQ657_000418 [Scheffersomyces spartinae]|uniref:Xylanolytic transcriptional activator regulatory domain-containing protein n=1 Tax=Scheffersomyces spartinae TaxID=45513 RepID=A0A9P7V9J6_9ASCO|nr:uncharacterized protein KQ657_000418 [Scheffersomyces spartinae]KAG7193727.1 hypothetical protein KQ657_000418 [Scheffersomyces spartinae]
MDLPQLSSTTSTNGLALEPSNESNFARIPQLLQVSQISAHPTQPPPPPPPARTTKSVQPSSHHHHPMMLLKPQPPPPRPQLMITELDWKHQVEGKLNNFDNKLNDLIDILKSNQSVLYDNQQRFAQIQQQQQLQQQQQQYPQHSQHSQHPYLQHPHHHYPYGSSFSYPGSRSYSPSDPQTTSFGPLPPSQQQQQQYMTYPTQPLQYISNGPCPPTNGANDKTDHIPVKRKIEDGEEVEKPNDKRIKSSKEPDEHFPDDFREGYLSKKQAEELFTFFDANIAQQLFGFEISRFSVEDIWYSSPILICAICTIASMHHPNVELSSKSKQLTVYLHSLCGGVLYKGKFKNDVEGFNTIVALVLCSFWLSDSQMFTGLALQLAKEIGLDSPKRKSTTGLSNKDRLKLWYLLYVLDGQQSLTFNRLPLINADDYSLSHSREMLLSDSNNISNTITNNNNSVNNAIEEVPAKEVDEIQPKTISNEMILAREKQERFTDMRLVSQVEYNQALNEAFRGDAWELLAPSSFGIPSKSNLELDKWMVSWTVLLSPGNYGAVWSSKSTLIYYNFAKMHINSSGVRQLRIRDDDKSPFPKWDQYVSEEPNKQQKHEPHNDEVHNNDDDDNDENDEDDEEEEFVSNRELICEDETIINANIAVNAAQTVLNLVLNDTDIISNLKYVPVHIHIMLYYAALLLINPPLISNDKRSKFDHLEYYKRLIDNLKTIKAVQYKINLNLPTDKKFGTRLMKSLEEIVSDKAIHLSGEIKKSHIQVEDATPLLSQLEILQSSSTNIEMFEASSSRGSSPGPEKISAWPGSNHGHP